MMLPIHTPDHLSVEEALDAAKEASRAANRARKTIRKPLSEAERYKQIRNELIKIAPPEYQSPQSINNLIASALDAMGEAKTGENFIKSANALLTAWAVQWLVR